MRDVNLRINYARRFALCLIGPAIVFVLVSLVGALVSYLMAPERPNVGTYADSLSPSAPRLSVSLLPSLRPGLWLGLQF